MNVLVIAGGPDPGSALIKKCAAQADKIYCADRGAQWAYQAGIKPDLVVGDMDSVNDSTLDRVDADGVRTMRYPVEKDMTDTQIALEVAISEGARSITLLGALGGRVDHTLANISLMSSYHRRGIRIAIMDNNTAMFVGERTITFRAVKGSTVSIFPVEEGVRVLRSEGLYYPLNDLVIPMDGTLCISNQMISDRVILDVRNGSILLIVTAQEKD
ncbi:MAG: thiamine diphosphokinase [Clostridia bacterium]|nr:thiamine diphosphokinase [Clostridia bacterium]